MRGCCRCRNRRCSLQPVDVIVSLVVVVVVVDVLIVVVNDVDVVVIKLTSLVSSISVSL